MEPNALQTSAPTPFALESVAEFWEKTMPWVIPAAVFLLLLLSLVTLRFLRKPKTILVATGDQGQTKIELQGLKDLVRRVVFTVEGVSKCSIRFSPGKRLNIMVTIQLKYGYRLDRITEQIQERLIESIQTNLGIETLGTIDVTATSFVGKIEVPDKTTSSETKNAEEDE